MDGKHIICLSTPSVVHKQKATFKATILQTTGICDRVSNCLKDMLNTFGTSRVSTRRSDSNLQGVLSNLFFVNPFFHVFVANSCCGQCEEFWSTHFHVV